MNFETSPRKKATMAERADTLLISENKTLVRELACDGKFSVNQTPVLGEEVVIRVQSSRWFITKRQWPARLVTCLVGVPEEDNGLTMRP